VPGPAGNLIEGYDARRGSLPVIMQHHRAAASGEGALGSESARLESLLGVGLVDHADIAARQVAEGIHTGAALWETLLEGTLDLDAEIAARELHIAMGVALDRAGGEGLGELFGGFSRVLAPVHAYRWRTCGSSALVELPVTTMPLLRTPIHGSYLLQLHEVSPRLARAYFRTALRLCLARGVAPSLLLHPTDVLGGSEAPGMEFFPGMATPGPRKVAWLGWVLAALREHFDVVGTGEYVRRSEVRRTRPVTRLDAGR